MRRFPGLALATLTILIACALPARADGPALVFAAASTQPVLERLKREFHAAGLNVTMNYGASSTLARQIELGGGAGAFLSANGRWMDHLEGQGLLEPSTRYVVATNTLALIVPQGTPVPRGAVVSTGHLFQDLSADQRIAIADPNHVPAGIYAKQALEHLGAWQDVQDNLVPTKDVTSALMQVARGEADFAIVYQSDAKRIDGVQIYGFFPPQSHDPIEYHVALIKGGVATGMLGFIEALTGPEGQAAFNAAGFGPKP